MQGSIDRPHRKKFSPGRPGRPGRLPDPIRPVSIPVPGLQVQVDLVVETFIVSGVLPGGAPPPTFEFVPGRAGCRNVVHPSVGEGCYCLAGGARCPRRVCMTRENEIDLCPLSPLPASIFLGGCGHVLCSGVALSFAFTCVLESMWPLVREWCQSHFFFDILHNTNCRYDRSLGGPLCSP